ncbi:Hypothetical predicted protein, partial [Pelobates cultripes]
TEIFQSWADIACIQETHFRNDRTPAIFMKTYPVQFHSQASTKTKGVSILVHRDVAFTPIEHSIDPRGRYIILVGQFNVVHLTLVATYFLNENPKQFLQMVLRKIDKIKRGNVILCRDFNCCDMITEHNGALVPHHDCHP